MKLWKKPAVLLPVLLRVFWDLKNWESPGRPSGQEFEKARVRDEKNLDQAYAQARTLPAGQGRFPVGSRLLAPNQR